MLCLCNESSTLCNESRNHTSMHYYGQCDVESGRRDAECRFLVHREYNGRRSLISRCETT